MVKHIILFQLKDELTENEKLVAKKEMKEGLEALVGKVPGLLEMHVQIEGLPSSNAEVMLYSVLESAEALKVYADWMKFNSRSIYGCTMAEPEYETPIDCRLTQSEDGKRLYVHLFVPIR